jgi:GNAT superfamily N-acetyltransferase
MTTDPSQISEIRFDAAIRKLHAAEESLFRDHLLRLDTESRQNRFLSAVNDSFLIEYAQRCFDSNTIVLGFLQDGVVRAAGELHTAEPREEQTAELGFSVEQEYRNQGVGTAMLRHLIVLARNRRLHHLRMNCHPRNLAMQAIARKFKAELHFEQGAAIGYIEPGSPTPFSLLMQALRQASEIGRAAIKLSQGQ